MKRATFDLEFTFLKRKVGIMTTDRGLNREQKSKLFPNDIMWTGGIFLVLFLTLNFKSNGTLINKQSSAKCASPVICQNVCCFTGKKLISINKISAEGLLDAQQNPYV